MILSLSFSRTCLKREYPWRSSWSSSDRSLTFNREQKLCCSEATLWPSAGLLSSPPSPSSPPSSSHHHGFAWRLRPAARCSVKTLALNHTLDSWKNLEGPESSVSPRGGGGDRSVGGGDYTHWHFFGFWLKRSKREDDSGLKRRFGTSDKTLRL